jgi:hypothetical protein
LDLSTWSKSTTEILPTPDAAKYNKTVTTILLWAIIQYHITTCYRHTHLWNRFRLHQSLKQMTTGAFSGLQRQSHRGVVVGANIVQSAL